MRTFTLLPFAAAALTTAFVVPDQQIFAQDEVESQPHTDHSGSWLKGKFNEFVDLSKDAFADVIDHARDEFAAAESWYETRKHDFELATEQLSEAAESDILHKLRRTTGKWQKDLGIAVPRCPYGDAKQKQRTDFDIFEADDEHHRRPPHHKRPHHHKPNQTVYQLIKKSKYTTKFAEIVDKYPKLVDSLNGTATNFTLFAPTNSAFEHIPEEDLTEEVVGKILKYHIVPELYPAGRVLKSRTLPTLLEGEGLSVKPDKTPQRLSTQISFKGLTLNFYSRVVAIDIFGTNGIIHGVNSLLFVPPKSARIVQLVPGYFSTLELALLKTGLFPAINDTSTHKGGVLFTPTNDAWARLGPGANAFLFSPKGLKYLKALIKYHVVPNITMYSNTLYVAEPKGNCSAHEERTFHIDLPTLLEDKYLSVDVARLGRIVDIRINGFNHVKVTDVPAYDGVLHLLWNVLIPPRTPGGADETASTDNISVDELRERLEPFVEHDDDAVAETEDEGFSFEL